MAYTYGSFSFKKQLKTEGYVNLLGQTGILLLFPPNGIG